MIDDYVRNTILESPYEISLNQRSPSNPMSLGWISGRANWPCLCARILIHTPYLFSINSARCSFYTIFHLLHSISSTIEQLDQQSSGYISITEPSFNSIAYWKKPEASKVVGWARKIVELFVSRRTSQWISYKNLERKFCVEQLLFCFY
jgi:hypothetical protein